MDPADARRIARDHRTTIRRRVVAWFTRTWPGCRRCGEPDPCRHRQAAWDVLDRQVPDAPKIPREWLPWRR